MPTVDITAPAGAFTPAAVGDAQDLTTTWTIPTAGNANLLTCNGASPFVSGDTGKSFNLVGAGTRGVNSNVLSGTLTFASPNTVTLSAAATTALSSTNTRLIWGTDDAPAFRAFNTWAQSQTSPIVGTLGTGSHSFFFNSSDSIQRRGNSPIWNVQQPITIQGNGPSSSIWLGGVGTSGSYSGFGFGVSFNIQSGNGAYSNSSIWTARLQTASCGDTQLRCITVADAALFANNTWSLITGIDLQGAGEPPNAFYFEYVFITNVDTINGILTLQSPLLNTYESTWPNINSGTPGLHSDKGGPATIYVIDQAWAVTATYQGIATDNGFNGQTGSQALSMTLNNVTCLDGFGIFPSVVNSFTCIGCDLSNYEMEYDKLVYSSVFDSTATGSIKNQNSNNTCVVQNGCTIRQFNGTPRFLSISDSTITTSFNAGTLAYGRTDRISFKNVTFSGGASLGYTGISDTGDRTGKFQTDYQMIGNGVIRATLVQAIRWAIPGTLCFLRSSNGARALPFRIYDITHDATYFYISTTLLTGWPSWADGLVVSPCTSVSAVNTTGIPQADNLTNMTLAGYAGKPVGTYNSTTFNNVTMGFINSGSHVKLSDQVWGNIISYVFNLTTPYTGVASTLTYIGPNAINFPGSGAIFSERGDTAAYFGQFNLKAGTIRTITPSGVTGTASGDSGLILPFASQPNWCTESFGQDIYASQNVTTEMGVGPVFTITIVTSQEPVALPTLQRMGELIMR